MRVELFGAWCFGVWGSEGIQGTSESEICGEEPPKKPKILEPPPPPPKPQALLLVCRRPRRHPERPPQDALRLEARVPLAGMARGGGWLGLRVEG